MVETDLKKNSARNRHITPALSQRRQFHRHHIEPEKKILPKGAGPEPYPKGLVLVAAMTRTSTLTLRLLPTRVKLTLLKAPGAIFA